MGTGSRVPKLRHASVHEMGRLNSWKEIAAYLDTSVRTVQRWERVEGLPVRRHEHTTVSTVYAYTSEVDAWFGSRTANLRPDPAPVPESCPSPRRLIVLPFRLVPPAPEIDFMAFGLADAITASLSSLDSLVVCSSLVAGRHAADADLKRIAAEAAVDLVLAGSIMRHAGQLRVTVQLLEASGGRVVGSHTAQGDLRDIFKLQDDVVRGVVDELALPLRMRDVELLTRDVPASTEAYECYLRANELAYNFDPAARDMYLRCVQQDPNYAPAWARLGRGYRIVAKFGGDPDDFGRAEDALKRALVLNPDLALAHHQLAYLEADSGRAVQAMLRLLERTRAGSHNPDLFAGLAHVCRYNGLLEASLKAAERASSLDSNVRTSVCHTYFMRGEYQKALETSNEVLGFLGPIALLALGRKEEARSLGREMERIGTPLPLVRCAFTWARALAEGARDEALGLLEQAIALMTHGPEELYYGARSFAWFSEHDRALAVLSRAVDEGFFCYPALARDPWLDGLRDSREFTRILQHAQECHSAAVRAYVQAGGDRILGTQVVARAGARR